MLSRRGKVGVDCLMSKVVFEIRQVCIIAARSQK